MIHSTTTKTKTMTSILGAEATYFTALSAGNFIIQRCTACSKHVFFPREICPHCRTTVLDWVQPTGTGTVYSTSTVRRKPELGGDYDVSLVDLDEGVRMMTRIDGIPPTEVRIGMRVRAEIVEGKAGKTVVFRPLGEMA